MSFNLKLFHFCSQVITSSKIGKPYLPSQVIEVGKSDDLEDSKFVSDDTDVEVTSEV